MPKILTARPRGKAPREMPPAMVEVQAEAWDEHIETLALLDMVEERGAAQPWEFCARRSVRVREQACQVQLQVRMLNRFSGGVVLPKGSDDLSRLRARMYALLDDSERRKRTVTGLAFVEAATHLFRVQLKGYVLDQTFNQLGEVTSTRGRFADGTDVSIKETGIY